MAALDIRGSGRFWLIVQGNHIVGGPFAGEHIAVASMHGVERRIRKAAAKPRPCLCCGESFDSEGAHNRMCPVCRELS